MTENEPTQQPAEPTTTPGFEVRVVTIDPNQAMNGMIDVWLCGMRAGAYSAIAMHHVDVDEPRLQAEVAALSRRVVEDPLKVEEIRECIAAHLAGIVTTAPGSPS